MDPRLTTHIDCVELLSSEGLRANGAGETVDVVDLAHGRAAVALADHFVATLVAHPEKVLGHFGQTDWTDLRWTTLI